MSLEFVTVPYARPNYGLYLQAIELRIDDRVLHWWICWPSVNVWHWHSAMDVVHQMFMSTTHGLKPMCPCGGTGTLIERGPMRYYSGGIGMYRPERTINCPLCSK